MLQVARISATAERDGVWVAASAAIAGEPLYARLGREGRCHLAYRIPHAVRITYRPIRASTLLSTALQ